MNFKLLGVIAIICAPFLYIDSSVTAKNSWSWQSGLFDFIYMLGWMGSIAALHKMKAFGTSKFAKIAVIIQFVFLSLAQVWNVWLIVGASDSLLFHMLDMCWPLSNIWMIVIGITALRAKRLEGWKRYVPLLVGLWFPVAVVPAITIGFYYLAGPYSAIAFALLGLVVYKSNDKETPGYSTVSLA